MLSALDLVIMSGKEDNEQIYINTFVPFEKGGFQFQLFKYTFYRRNS